ncbi:MAG: hypothetical protein QY312_01115 [Candidatus Dojkabacteria bacterium]|nr:MAG: hypothetical protein QY312_01115 [Candidatus Dojkabacteria bacterium]
MEARIKKTFPTYTAIIGDEDKIWELSAKVQLPIQCQQPDNDRLARESLLDRGHQLCGFISMSDMRGHGILKNTINLIAEDVELRVLLLALHIPVIYAADSPDRNGLWLYIHKDQLQKSALITDVNDYLQIVSQYINDILKKKPAAEVPPQYRHL